MEAVKAGRHEEGRAINMAGEAKGGVLIFINLKDREQSAQSDGQNQTPFQALAVIMLQSVMRPCDGRARGQQDKRIDERQVPRVKCSMPCGGQTPPVNSVREA